MSREKVNIEDFKELVDSRLMSKTEIKDNSQQLLKARLESYEKSDKEDAIIMSLYRLKLMLEEEVNTEDLKSAFYTYSSAYIDLLYSTRKSFASDIDFSETQLSLILSGKRPATEEFVSKIKQHSNKIYQKLNIEFNSYNWFKIYHLDRMHSYLTKNQRDKVSFKNLDTNLKSLKII